MRSGSPRSGAPSWPPPTCLWSARDRAWLVVRNDFQVDTSRDWAFQKDALAVRLRGRFAVAAPVMAKALRRLSVTGPDSAQAAGSHRSGKAA